MLIFKRRHAHVRMETLSDYLDGRLQESVAARVDRQVIDCAACRQELESLRSTVSLLRQLPEVAPPRSFTLTGPPAQPVEGRPLPLLAMPQWVYAAAASAAVLVLAVLVSADATGLLARSDAIGAGAVVQELAAAAPAMPDAALPERSAPLEVAESLAAPKGEAIAVAVVQEAETSKAKAISSIDEVAEAAAPPVTLSEMPRVDDVATPAPMAAQALAAEPLLDSRAPAASEEEPAQQLSLAREPSTEETTEETTAPTAPPIIPQPSSLAAEAGSSEDDATGGTALVWRVVEGLAAAAGLAFLAGLLLKRRTLRRPAKN